MEGRLVVLLVADIAVIGGSWSRMRRVVLERQKTNRREKALRVWEIITRFEATELAKPVRVPTLVLHCRGERVAPLEEGRYMARLIPGASFIELPGNNHALLALAGTSGFDQFLEEATNFIVMHGR